MTEPYIFISHSNQDKAAVAEIVDDLQAKGIQLWVDFDRLESGSQWLNRIEGAIEDCAGLVVVISRTSRRAEWVMRECLYAMQLQKPVFIARIDDVLLPLLLVDRQYADFAGDYDKALVDLTVVLEQTLENPPQPTQAQSLPESISLDPNQDNFFTYLAQVDNGDAQSEVAQNLFEWAKDSGLDIEFSGRFRPAFHVKIDIDDKAVTIFSVLAYLRHPALQIPLDTLSKYPPYTNKKQRLNLLHDLDQLQSSQFDESRADRRPSMSLNNLLDDTRLNQFKQILRIMIENLSQA